MKHWHATLIWFFCLGALLMTGYVPKKVEKVSVISSPISDLAFYEDQFEVIISYRVAGEPYQLELIKEHAGNTQRAIVRTRMIDGNTDTSDIENIRGVVEDIAGSIDGYRLGNTGYSVRLEGYPLYFTFESIIGGRGSYECLMFASEWTIDRQTRVVTVKGSPTNNLQSPYSSGLRDSRLASQK